MYVACFSEFNPHANMRNAGAIIGTSALAPGAIRASAAMYRDSMTDTDRWG